MAPKCQGEKRCEIKGGGQEMAVIIVHAVAKILIMTNSGKFGAESW